MIAERERFLLQCGTAFACLVPLYAGLSGIIEGAGMIGGVESPISTDLDSHFRYLSGLLLGIGVGFAWCIPRIEERGSVYLVLGFSVFLGGLARLFAAIEQGFPTGGHVFGLVMELGVVPLLVLWQARVARRYPNAKAAQTQS